MDTGGAGRKQLLGVAELDETIIGDGERDTQLRNEPVLVGEVGVWRHDCLQLDEAAKLLDAIEMDANIAPEKQAPAPGEHHTSYADCGGESSA